MFSKLMSRLIAPASKMRLRTKLLGSFAVIAGATLLTGAIGWSVAGMLSGHLVRVGTVRLAGMEHILRLSALLESIKSADMILLDANIAAGERQNQYRAIQAAMRDYALELERYDGLARTAEESELYRKLRAALAGWEKEHGRFLDLCRKLDVLAVHNPLRMKTDIEQFRGDLYKLQSQTSYLIQTNTVFDGGDDPGRTHFGRWMREFSSGNRDLQRIVQEIEPQHQAFYGAVAKIKKLVSLGRMQEASISYFTEMAPAAEVMFGLFDRLRDKATEAEELYTRMGDQARGSIGDSQKEVRAALERLIGANKEAVTVSVAESLASADRGTWMTGYMILLGLLCASLVLWYIARAIVGPIMRGIQFADSIARGDLSASIDDGGRSDEVGMLMQSLNAMARSLRATAKMAERISEGDLTVRVDARSDNDNLGRSLRHMLETMSGTIADMHVTANAVASGAEQMSATSQVISLGASEQASSLEEISGSMNEIAFRIGRSAESATLARCLSDDAKAQAQNGTERMRAMVEAMRGINESSREISKIIRVIEDIAFQTNLLSLNAAVEAARAGRHGKGFAVVAGEVRALAGRSARAAKETAELIESSIKKIESGTGIANATAAALDDIIATAARVTGLVCEIAAASNDQAKGIAHITTGLGQIDTVMQHNMAHAEQSASAAQDLTRQAVQLQRLVSGFRIAPDGIAGRRSLESEPGIVPALRQANIHFPGQYAAARESAIN